MLECVRILVNSRPVLHAIEVNVWELRLHVSECLTLHSFAFSFTCNQQMIRVRWMHISDSFDVLRLILLASTFQSKPSKIRRMRTIISDIIQEFLLPFPASIPARAHINSSSGSAEKYTAFHYLLSYSSKMIHISMMRECSSQYDA